MRILLLSDAMHHLPKIAQWFHSDWGNLLPWADEAVISQRLYDACESSTFSKCFVAVSDADELLGTASLKLNELSHHREKTYWLGEVYVSEAHRGKGLGSLLTKAVITHALTHRVDQLFLYTPDQQALYAKLGWRVVGTELVNGEEVSLMVCEPAAQQLE
jgi:GNAT superfamily N-acetyltransferase